MQGTGYRAGDKQDCAMPPCSTYKLSQSTPGAGLILPQQYAVLHHHVNIACFLTLLGLMCSSHISCLCVSSPTSNSQESRSRSRPRQQELASPDTPPAAAPPTSVNVRPARLACGTDERHSRRQTSKGAGAQVISAIKGAEEQGSAGKPPGCRRQQGLHG